MALSSKRCYVTKSVERKSLSSVMSDYQPASSSLGSPMVTATPAVIARRTSGHHKTPASYHNSSHHHAKKVTARKSIPKREEKEEEEEEERTSVDSSPAPSVEPDEEEEEEEDLRKPIPKKRNRRRRKRTAEEVQKIRHKQRVKNQKLNMSSSLKSLHMSCESMVMSEEGDTDEYSSHSTCGPNDSDTEMMQKTANLDATQLMEMIKLKISGHHLNPQPHALPDHSGRNSKKNNRRRKLRGRRRGVNSAKT